MCGCCIVNVIVSVVEGHHLIKMMPIRIRDWIPDWLQNNAYLNADPSPGFAHFGKLGLIFLLLIDSFGRLKDISCHMSGKCALIFMQLWRT